MKFSKKLLSMVLAGALAISASISAFAANTSTQITGTYQNIEIEVNVPRMGTAFINPYKLPLTVGTSSYNAGQQIFTAPMVVENLSELVDLDVSAKLTGTTVSSGMTLASEKLESDATAKSAFVYFQMAPTSATSLAAVDTDYYDSTKWSAYNARNCLVLQAGRDSAFENETVLATITKTDASGAAQAGSLAMFRLTGDCVKAPRTPWETTDTFSTTVAFTFAPHEAANP